MEESPTLDPALAQRMLAAVQVCRRCAGQQLVALCLLLLDLPLYLPPT